MNREAPSRPTADLVSAMRSNSQYDSSISDTIERELSKGAGLFGETDPIRSREASGMLNHSLKTGRLSGQIGREINQLHIPRVHVDVDLGEQAHDVSHIGRLLWDYADPETKKLLVETYKTNENLGIDLLRRYDVSPKVFLMVQALGHGDVVTEEIRECMQTIEFKIAIYADHRTDQKIMPLEERMADFVARNFLKEKTSENIEYTKIQVTDLIRVIKKVPEARRKMTGEQAAITLARTDKYLQEARGSTLAGLIQLIIDNAKTEYMLERWGLHPEKWDDTTVKPRRWEQYLRRLNIQATEIETFARIYTLKTVDAALLLNQDKTIYTELGTNPNRQWWDENIRTDYTHQSGIPSTIRRESSKTLRDVLPRQSIGAERAVRFFEYLDMNGHAKKDRRRKIYGANSWKRKQNKGNTI